MKHFENDEISAKVGFTKNQISQKVLRGLIFWYVRDKGCI